MKRSHLRSVKLSIIFIHKYGPTKDFLLYTSADGMSTIANEKIAFEVKFVQIILHIKRHSLSVFIYNFKTFIRDLCGRGRMVVTFTATYAVSAYHH